MVEQGMELDAAFVFPEKGPRKVGFGQRHGSGVQAVEPVCKGKAMLGSYCRCFFKELTNKASKNEAGRLLLASEKVDLGTILAPR